MSSDDLQVDILALDDDDPRLAPLPHDIGALCSVVQGLLIHDAALHLYGPQPEVLAIDRTTRPVRERVSIALSRTDSPLTTPRPPFERQVGTCRDFAAMLCAFARRRGYEARVRCGFAAYLGVGWQDHWVCEYRSSRNEGWLRADPQIDPEHSAAFGVEFDATSTPEEQFLTADRAWGRWRAGAAAETFGHGRAAGERFLFVNLARDALARADALTSAWDRWRAFGDMSEKLNAPAQSIGDRLAADELDARLLLRPNAIETLLS